MNTLKKIVEFIRTKLGSAMAKNLSVEEQYTAAAAKLLDKIKDLKLLLLNLLMKKNVFVNLLLKRINRLNQKSVKFASFFPKVKM